MYVVIVHIQIKPEQREPFIAAMLANAKHSVEDEPGCLRFDVVQDESDANQLLLYEIYRDEAAFGDHLKTPHFLRWRDTVRDWHAVPPRSWKGIHLYPPDQPPGQPGQPGHQGQV